MLPFLLQPVADCPVASEGSRLLLTFLHVVLMGDNQNSRPFAQ